MRLASYLTGGRPSCGIVIGDRIAVGGLSERILPLTSQLIFSVAAVVSYVGTIITLVPSDLIATGTPAGAGAARTPPRFLADGETVVTSLEGLGEQRNPCVAEQAVASCR